MSSIRAGNFFPTRNKRDLRRFLEGLGYDYVDESANPAYRMFLGS